MTSYLFLFGWRLCGMVWCRRRIIPLRVHIRVIFYFCINRLTFILDGQHCSLITPNSKSLSSNRHVYHRSDCQKRRSLPVRRPQWQQLHSWSKHRHLQAQRRAEWDPKPKCLNHSLLCYNLLRLMRILHLLVAFHPCQFGREPVQDSKRPHRLIRFCR